VIGRERMEEYTANQVFFGLTSDEHERTKRMIYELWSGPTANTPESQAVLSALRAILREISDPSRPAAGTAFEPRRAFAAGERFLKSIFIHAFQDAGSFDLSRVRRCCNAYPQVDGRLIPCCRRNVLGVPEGGAKVTGDG
jgi:hypothetical protein